MIYDEIFRATGYRPHAGQLRFHESDARFKVLIAGARFGKSLAASKDVLTDLIGGTCRGWLVAPTYTLALPEYRYLCEDLRRLSLPFTTLRRDGRRGYSGFRTGWGAEALCLSAHLPHTLLGEEIDWMILCEAAHLRREAFERFLRARLATRRGRLIAPTTPRGYNWIHELYRHGRGDARDWISLRFATWDNPGVASAEIEDARSLLPPETFAEQYGGEFTHPSGLVYREFRRDTHVAQGLMPSAGDVIRRGIDFGYANPFCCLWAKLDGEGRLLILREYYRARLSLIDNARAVRAIDDEFRGRGCVIQPAFADPSGAGERAMLRDDGIETRAADNRVRTGIEAVRRRLLLRADGTPGLLIDAGCASLLREIENYVWGDFAGGDERPRKGDDHALDALRYLCATLDRSGATAAPPTW